MDTSPGEPPPYSEQDPVGQSSHPLIPWHKITPCISPRYIPPRTHCAIEKLYTKWFRDFIQSRNGTVLFDKGPTVIHLQQGNLLWRIKSYFSESKALSFHGHFLTRWEFLHNADNELFMEYLVYEVYSGNALTDKQVFDIVPFMQTAGIWREWRNWGTSNTWYLPGLFGLLDYGLLGGVGDLCKLPIAGQFIFDDRLIIEAS